MQEKQKNATQNCFHPNLPHCPKIENKTTHKSFGKFFAYCSFPKTAKCNTKICEKRLTVYKKLQNGNVRRKKMQEKQKKCHIRLLLSKFAPPLPQKRKQNTHRSFGKFFAYCSFPKNSVNVTQKICEKRLTGYKKLQNGNVRRKNARKAKKTPTRLLLSKTVRREKKENENVRNLQGKIYRKMQKMRISPHFLQLIER